MASTPEATAGSRLSRNVLVLSWVSLFQDAASEMLYPVLPLFISGVLGAPPVIVGAIEGLAEAMSSAMKIVSGHLADLRRRKPLVAWGYGISSVSKPLIGLATAWPMVLVARVLDRAGKGLRTSPRDALIVADTPPSLRGRAFGFHRAADTAGAVVGPLAGVALYAAVGHRLRPLFFVAFVPAALSVALVGLVRERPQTHRARTRTMTEEPIPPTYWRVLAVLTAFGLANFTDALLILRAKHLGLGFVGVLLAYTAYNASYSLLSYPAGRISDRIPRRLVFATGLGIFSVAYVGLGLVTSPLWVWVLFPLYGGYTALTDGVGKAWVADLLPASRVGRGLGLYQGLSGAATLLAGVWAGLAWGGSGRVPLVVSGTVAAGLALALAGGRSLDPNGQRLDQ